MAEREELQLKQALDALTKMRVRLEAAERGKSEPIAIVGLGCRFPGGAHDPESFWSLLMNRVDAVTEVPVDRWDATRLYDPDPLVPGKASTRWGAFLEDIDRFDAEFFGISPREAARMDPQQRLLLEVAWSALEDAGLAPAGLAGQSAGVFVGVHSHSVDYWALQARDRNGLDPYAGTGTSHSVLAGRLSYLLDLHGPSMAVDTACSSSLVAVHLACQALRAGECAVALAAGVNVILSPEFTVAASRMQMLAADGRCKAFDSRADGFVRGEGCGVIVLKRLTDALAAGDPVRAVIRGSGVNQDGRTNGLTAPSGPAQTALIRSVLTSAGVAGAEIGYVEAHGTGTPLGDPIEVEALAAALGARPADRPCHLGSVKANLGHLEGAAGIAGLIKATLAVQHGMIPPQVHFKRLNPHIDLDASGLAVSTEPRAWSAGSAPRRAGVSSFGWSGTNAHVVLEQASPSAVPAVETAGPRLLVVSARSRRALDNLIRRYPSFLDVTPATLGDIAHTAALRRAHHPHRAAVVAGSKAEAAVSMRALLDGAAPRGAVVGARSESGPPRVVFVFPGQGSQWLGMGRGLLDASPAFRGTLEACDRALRAHVDWSLIDELTAGLDTSRLHEIDVVQPVLWAIQVALAAHWRTWGVEPAAVVGHSMGEIAAAHVAGALTLADSASVICRRSRLLRSLSGRGGMALVELSRAEAEAALRGHEAQLSVAVLSGPRSTVISGEPGALEQVLTVLRGRGVFCREISVDVASHSPQVDAILPQLRADLADLSPRAGTIPMYSTVTGARCGGAMLDATYWCRNLREPVLFANVVQALVEAGHTAFLEVSPHPVLTPAVEDTLATLAVNGTVVASLRRQEDELATMLESLGALWAVGAPVMWERLFESRHRPVALPAYPWQRERFWLETVEPDREIAMLTGDPPGHHRLPGRPIELADGPDRAVWEMELAGGARADALEHRVGDLRLLPAAAVVTMMSKAAGAGARTLIGVELRQPVILPEPGARLRIQTVLTSIGAPEARVAVYSRGADEGWTLHAEARVPTSDRTPAGAVEEPIAATTGTATDEAGAAFYEELARLDVELPPDLRVIHRLRRAAGEAVATLEGRDSLALDDERDMLVAALDACFQLPTAAGLLDAATTVAMPARVDEVRVHAGSGRPATARALRRTSSAAGGAWDVRLLDEGGRVLVELIGFRLKGMSMGGTEAAGDLYEVEWSVSPPGGAASTAGRWILLADAAGVAPALARRLEADGGATVAIPRESGWEQSLRKQLGETECRGVIVLWALDEEERVPVIGDLPPTACQDALDIVQAMLEPRDARPARLWLVTRGAQPVGPDGATRPLTMPVWGLGRVIAEEHPEMWGGLVDLDPARSPEADARDLRAALAGAAEAPEAAFRRGARYVPRLIRSRVADTAPALRPDASYLITGGLGALGLRVARWMASRGARHLVLLSRTPLPPRAEWPALTGAAAARAAAIVEIEAVGARVHHAAVDVGDRAALRAFLDGQRHAGVPALHGVVHTAAAIDDRLLHRLDRASLGAVWRGKALGAWVLHEALAQERLDFFALFSSLGSVLGQTGQGAYAVANAFLDGLAHHRHAAGLPAVSIDWAAWGELGFAGTTGGRQVVEDLRRQGIEPLDPDRALGLLERALATGRPQVAALARTAVGPARGSQAARLLADPRDGGRTVERATEVAAAVELRALEPEPRRMRLQGLLCESLGRVLKVAPERVDVHKPLGALGVDSLIALEFRRHLEATLGLALPATMIWNHPTVIQLAAYLSGRLAPDEVAPVPAPAAEIASVGRTVEHVDQLSDEEAAQALLAARRPARGR